jgi:hypothetical protein
MAKEGFCYAHPQCGNRLHVVQGADNQIYQVTSATILSRSKARKFCTEPESEAAKAFRKETWDAVNDKKKARETEMKQETIKETVLDLALTKGDPRAIMISAEFMLQEGKKVELKPPSRKRPRH